MNGNKPTNVGTHNIGPLVSMGPRRNLPQSLQRHLQWGDLTCTTCGIQNGSLGISKECEVGSKHVKSYGITIGECTFINQLWLIMIYWQRLPRVPRFWLIAIWFILPDNDFIRKREWWIRFISAFQRKEHISGKTKSWSRSKSHFFEPQKCSHARTCWTSLLGLSTPDRFRFFLMAMMIITIINLSYLSVSS